jgi:transposase-like protein
MAFLVCSCSQRVGQNIKYCECGNYMIKYGKDSRQKQRYFCKKCKTTKVEFYTYKAYKQDINQNIVSLTKEGVGILSTTRLLAISPITLLKRIKQIASNITQPSISIGKTYEMRLALQIAEKYRFQTKSLVGLVIFVSRNCFSISIIVALFAYYVDITRIYKYVSIRYTSLIV